ncbi:MAG: FadR family transcriptional regulator [Anaerolineae bacterium]|jgi:DNA-binding FadR family transcriptional regulator|nr:FadR family transcriptional regulator [Anaerolineae bacterium]MBT7072423.1 FadR family transcriptional regulator [Anaerolineae bacterium]MBT7326580.1 FadR family transcriptional regulator [Anaerolineae bacterium]
MYTKLSEFLKYLATHEQAETEGIPALDKLSDDLEVNRAALREQLAVARALGLVAVKPRIGTRRLPYTFTPALQQSLGYALLHNQEYFEEYSDLRTHIESAYFHEAVKKLLPEDIQELKDLLECAWEKLRGNPVQIPHEEHRDLHLMMYRRLNNIFVIGILEAYWEAYEAVGLNVFTDYSYLTKVWEYHSGVVDAIATGDFAKGFTLLMEHTELIAARPNL